MSIADRLQNTQRSETGLPCGIAKLYEKLEGDDKAALEAVLSRRSVAGQISNRQIHDILLAEGHDVAFASISTHRRQQCRCFTGKNSEVRKTLSQKDF